MKPIFPLLFSFFIAILAIPSFAQLPPLQPEQDCINAIPICNNTYTQVNSYVGEGSNPNEIPAGTCLSSNERNGVWYSFTVQSSGLFGFDIIPVNLGDDYDWAVFNLTNTNCAAIATQATSLIVSCNYSGTPGVTGCNGSSTLNSQTAIGTPFNALLNVTAGQSYVLYISNFSSSNNGYTINLNPPATVPPGQAASLFDNIPPTLIPSDTVYCGNPVVARFNEFIFCNSVNNNTFKIITPNNIVANITSATGINCLSGRSNRFSISFSPALPGTGYQLILQDTVQDNCGNPSVADTILFDIYPHLFVVGSPDPNLCVNQLGNANMVIYPLSTITTFQWNGANITGPTNLSSIGFAPVANGYYTGTAIAPNGCFYQDSIYITVSDLPVITDIKPLNDTICFADSILLSVTTAADPSAYYFNWQGYIAFADYLSLSNPANDSTYLKPRTGGKVYGFTVNVSDTSGCTTTSQPVYITVGEELLPAFELDTTEGTVPFMVQTTNISTGTGDYNWRLFNLTAANPVPVFVSPEFSPEIPLNEGGLHRLDLVMSDLFGCSNVASELINAQEFIIQNVITANNDGFNDFLTINGRSNLKVRIFNRWGVMVYSNDDYRNDWNGQDLPASVYYYNIDHPASGENYRGWIQVIK